MECRTDPEVYFDDFENGDGIWFADNGVWQIGIPSSGPGSASSGEVLAATVLDGNYPTTSSRLISPPIDLPVIDVGKDIFLRFQHWFAFGANWHHAPGSPYRRWREDSGIVQIREKTTPGQWTEWTTLKSYSGSSKVYSNTLVDLSGYAGKEVQIGFRLASGGANPLAGWYIDDVRILVN